MAKSKRYTFQEALRHASEMEDGEIFIVHGHYQFERVRKLGEMFQVRNNYGDWLNVNAEELEELSGCTFEPLEGEVAKVQALVSDVDIDGDFGCNTDLIAKLILRLDDRYERRALPKRIGTKAKTKKRKVKK